MNRRGGKREGAGRKKLPALAKITREINKKHWKANHQYIYLENRVCSTWQKVRAEGTFVNDSNFASFSIFQFPIMLCVLGGKQKSKMAEEIRFPELTSYSSVAKKNKNELRKICRILELPSEKLGKNALINIVCNSLRIPTSCQHA